MSIRRRGGDALKRWLKQHSGLHEGVARCERHPTILDMTNAQQIAALREDTGLEVTRQHLWALCRRLGIPRRGKAGPPRRVSAEEKRKASLARWQHWYARVKVDPEALDAYRRKQRASKRSRNTPSGTTRR